MENSDARRDAALVNRFNAGDESAFLEIIALHRERVFLVALGVLKNKADSEEIVQDTFIRAHRALASFRGESSLATWLHRIALNLSRNRYRYFARRQRNTMLSLECPMGRDGNTSLSELLATDASGPVQQAAINEFLNLVAGCLRKLEAQSREIIMLRNSFDYSYDEIARLLGLKVGTVKSRLMRARESLRKLLFGTCPEFHPHDELSALFETCRPSMGGKDTLAEGS